GVESATLDLDIAYAIASQNVIPLGVLVMPPDWLTITREVTRARHAKHDTVTNFVLLLFEVERLRGLFERKRQAPIGRRRHGAVDLLRCQRRHQGRPLLTPEDEVPDG